MLMVGFAFGWRAHDLYPNLFGPKPQAAWLGFWIVVAVVLMGQGATGKGRPYQ